MAEAVKSKTEAGRFSRQQSSAGFSMTLFIGVFSVILLISLFLAGLLYLLDRYLKPGESTRAPVHPSIFEFFTTLYAIFLGFALFTLWSAYLTMQRNIAKEADTLFNAYRSSLVSPDFLDFRLALREYVILIVEDEWDRMANGTMSPTANKKFDQVLEQLQLQKPRNGSGIDLYWHVSALMEEASALRLSRGLSLTGNLYRPIWVIIIFGFFTILFGLYYLHVRQTMALLIFNFMVLYLLLSCIYVIYDIDQPFSGTISVSSEVFQSVLAKMPGLP
jgi:hypothetical protein